MALSACFATSIHGMRERPPVLVSDSDRGVREVSQCISDAWVRLGHTPRTTPREHGTSIFVEQVVNYALPIMLVDIDAIPTGTHVVMHQFKTLHAGGDGRRIEEVRACL